MEQVFIVGEGWSGDLHIYEPDGLNCPFVLHWYEHGMIEGMHHIAFKRREDCEQYMDELDAEWNDYPFFMPGDNLLIEAMEVEWFQNFGL